MSLSGGCVCGQIRYEIAAPLRNARSCHCSRCRQTFGGAGSAYAEVEPGTFSWTAGERELVAYETMAGLGLVFFGSRAPWDHIGDGSVQHEAEPP